MIAKDDGFTSVEITQLNRSQREICLKMGPRSGTELPDRLDLLPNFALNPRPIPGAIRKVIADQCGPRSNRSAQDLLSRNPPRFDGPSPLPLDEDTETLDGLIEVVRAMNGSVLPVQGPPGTGGSRARGDAPCARLAASRAWVGPVAPRGQAGVIRTEAGVVTGSA